MTWFICPKPDPQARMRLYCFPYAGGGVPVFRSWPERLPAGVELWVANLPGRGFRLRETPYSRMLPLVQALSRAFAPPDNLPFVFFGHSLGARVGFELARSLRRQARPQPTQLFVSACPAPQLPVHTMVHNLPKKAFLAELERRNGVPQEVLNEPELMDLLLPLLRADFAVFETAVYNAEPPLQQPIIALGGKDDPLVNRQELAAWQEQTSGLFQMHAFAGDHFYLRTAEADLLRMIAITL